MTTFLSLMLHIMDIHAPYSKVTSNDFNFRNYYPIIYNLIITILMKKTSVCYAGADDS